MEEGTKTKKTVYVGGLADDVNEDVLLETFSPFGQYFLCFGGFCLYILFR